MLGLWATVLRCGSKWNVVGKAKGDGSVNLPYSLERGPVEGDCVERRPFTNVINRFLCVLSWCVDDVEVGKVWR